MIAQQTGVAFSVDAKTFIGFARALAGEIMTTKGTALTQNDLIDLDLCWAFDLSDPWGIQYELNCCEYDRIKADQRRGNDRDSIAWSVGLADCMEA